jgi:beta-galactosidase
MNPITFDACSYRLGGEPVYLNAGEFHYFRVPRSDWARRMALFREAGGNCLATYVPWLLHEPEEGRFSFGRGEHDQLEAFLETAAAAGLHVIARPGPYQYSELVCSGLPRWLCGKYPQVLACDPHGKPYTAFSVSYLHPLLLEKARAWYDAVCPILARHTVERGGPIAFLQVDNELAGIHVWFGGPDYHREAMGFGRPDGRFPRFLRRRYRDLARLNHAYSLNAESFEEVPPAALHGANTPAELRRRRDYLEFYLETVAEYA